MADVVTGLNPVPPSSLGQRAASGAALAVGASTTETVVRIEAAVADFDGDTVKLQVEIRAVGTPFSNAFTHEGPLLTGGSLASIAVTGLAPGTDYHWQVRTVDAGGAASDWAAFGGNAETAPDFSVTASANTAPTAPTAAAQLRADGITPIAGGATTTESTVVLSGAMDDPDGDAVRLLLELRPLATPFTGTPTHVGTFVASASTGTIEATGLAPGSWHWQIAVEDAKGVVSSFTTPGGSPDFVVDLSTNVNPAAPTLPGQFEALGAAIPLGGSTPDAVVVFRATCADPDGGSVRLQVEVRPIGTAFGDTPSGESAIVASGGSVSVTIGGLTGDYHWQLRVVDASGGASPWVSFGANPETSIDLSASEPVVPPTTPSINTRHRKKLCGASEGGSPVAIALFVPIALLIMRRWR